MLTIGIIGGGQLAMMLASAATELGLDTLCLVDDLDSPARCSSKLFQGSLSDQQSLIAFAKEVDLVTLENENVDVAPLKRLAERVPVYPDPEVIAIAQDRLREKEYLQSLGLQTAPYAAISDLDDLVEARASLPGAAILKTRRLGYDGKGQLRLHAETAPEQTWLKIQQPAVLEQFVDFSAEVSVLVARNKQGQVVCFPLLCNEHEQGILHRSSFAHDAPLQHQAERIATRLVTELSYIGVLAIEFFVTASGLVINELAPRVHNSGHLTIEGCNVSQFSQHCRAITGLDLLVPEIINDVAMLNVIGEWPQEIHRHQKIYDYNKQPRPGRKLGHLIV